MNKKILFLITSMMISFPLFAQNTFPASGNVGIGISNPQFALDVRSGSINLDFGANKAFRTGYLAIGQTLLKSLPYLSFNAILTTSTMSPDVQQFTPIYKEGSGLVITGEAGFSGLHFYQKDYNSSSAPQDFSSFKEVMTLSATGRLGIGTTNPLSALDVQSGPITVGIGANKSFRTGYVSIGNTTLNNMPYISFNALLTTSEINGQNIFTPIYPNGNSPAGTTGSGLIIMGDPGRSGLRFLQRNYADASSQDLSSFAEVLTLTSNGTVGIGTNLTGSHKLAVEGSIAARKVKILQTGWADFVFHPDYQLPTLYEVEEYIKANQHLPEIPSAAEIEKDGIDVAEIDKKLLQKIEELTLHMIEMRKEMDLLQQENQALKTAIQKVAIK